MKKILIFVFAVLFGHAAVAQIRVTGTVTSSDDGSPVSFATVVVKGNNSLITNTDMDGKFVFNNVPNNAVLIVSYIGFTTLEVPLNNRSVVNITISPDATALEEVMVVAYGTTTRASFTGSANQVSSALIEQRPVTNVANALAGIAPGVQLTSANGQPGSESGIRIRGVGSFSASNSPLIILDQIPYTGSFSSINPADIESISILKDASSSALYGSRAANGVVLVTTKKGKQEKTEIQFRLSNGFTSREIPEYARVGINDYLELYWENMRNKSIRENAMSPEQAAQQASNNLFNQLTYNPYNLPKNQVVGIDGKVNPTGKLLWADDLDWTKAIQQLGYRQDYTLSISGRNDKTDYYASFGYTGEKGYIIGSNFARYSARTNINSQVTKWLKAGINLSANMSYSGGNQDEGMGNNSNPFLFTRFLGPIYPIHLHNPEDGSYILDDNGNPRYDFGVGYGALNIPKRDLAAGNNPAIELRDRIDKYKRNMITAKPYVEFSFLNNFKLALNASVNANSYLATSSAIVYPEKGNTGSATKTNSFTTSWTLNQLLTWERSFGQHNIDLLLGHESYDYEYNYLTASKKDESFAGNPEFGNYANINTTPSSYTNEHHLESYFSRLNYNFYNKYMLTGSFRRDGGSRFYKDVRWGNFWSVGAAWRLEQEKFIQQLTFIDQLKLRASFGEVGNENIGGYYTWQALYELSQNANEPGYVQSSLGNRNLSWEKNSTYDAALEFSLFHKLHGSFEYFFRQSSNLLFSIPLSPSTGMSAQDMNAGTMYNAGIEAQITYEILRKKDLLWSINANVTSIKNKITQLPIDPFNRNNSFQRVQEGHSQYDWWLLQWIGVDAQTGDCLYLPMEDATNTKTIDGVLVTTDINQAKEDWSGSSMPKLYGGLGTSFQFKNFNLSLLFSYQWGGKMYDFIYAGLMAPNTRPNSALHQDLLGRWNAPGQQTNIPRLDDGTTAASLNGARSTRWLISSNMLELTNINLSYDLPSNWIQKIGMKQLRIYAAGNNVFMSTKRKGMNANYSLSGYDNNGNRFSPSRTLTLGLTINL
ncbi:MAG: TonB-dependent receptor [Bacteroidetes bacterium]|nr:TonB-dependent receptor [Bacteroidota bacterium]